MTLRRLSEALRSIDLQDLTQNSQMELGMGLEALDGSSAESINSSLEVRSSVAAKCLGGKELWYSKSGSCRLPRVVRMLCALPLEDLHSTWFLSSKRTTRHIPDNVQIDLKTLAKASLASAGDGKTRNWEPFRLLWRR